LHILIEGTSFELGITNSKHCKDLSKQHHKNGKEQQEYPKISDNGIDHSNNVTETLEDSQIEETLDDLLEEDHRHQKLVTQGEAVCEVLRDHVEERSPHIDLVGVVEDVLEVLLWTEEVQLSDIVEHGVNDTQHQQDTVQVCVSLVIVDVNSIHVNDHDCEVTEMEEASNKHETSGEGLPLESDKLIKLICFEELKLICLSTELQK
jgi:hypothetical protein